MFKAAQIVGIDIAKDTSDVYFLTDKKHLSIPKKEYHEFVKKLLKAPPTLVVMEATGGYERMLAGLLTAAAIPLAIVNPRQVRDFAKATNQLAKTDAIDARIIAMFAEATKVQAKPLPSQEVQALRDLIERRRQLVAMRTAEANREKKAENQKVKDNIKSMRRTINQHLTDLDKDLNNRIRKSPAWREAEDLLVSVPGVGQITARTLITEMPELGTANKKQIAALAGVAPMNQDSGKYRGQRHIRGGRGKVRAALYMAALAAIRCNPTLRPFYNRLKSEGKSFKVAITACMRKLLIILNEMMKKKQLFYYKKI